MGGGIIQNRGYPKIFFGASRRKGIFFTKVVKNFLPRFARIGGELIGPKKFFPEGGGIIRGGNYLGRGELFGGGFRQVTGTSVLYICIAAITAASCAQLTCEVSACPKLPHCSTMLQVACASPSALPRTFACGTSLNPPFITPRGG